MGLEAVWRGEVVAIATMHGKEQVIGPLLAAAWGLRAIVPAGLNTDVLGTFTRDVARPGDALATARLKAEAALALTGGAIAVASEGSFGPHPDLPWAAVNRELVVLIDRQRGIELVGEALSWETNYRQTQVRTWEEAQAFAAAVGFPDHGLVVGEAKGVRDRETLAQAVQAGLAQSGILWLETDMRAMHNPSRMQVIAQATQDLVAKGRSLCPVCGWPGFAITERWPGLPCALCGLPTPLVRSQRWVCRHCGYQQEEPVAETVADPAYCPLCNP
ncbi:MAG TPA: hypothetical protein DCQ32_05260 [Cyanobacteria bacterium UBA8156]|nr:hypothetical protein [Cyanobacteria bacterium UBA8156]